MSDAGEHIAAWEAAGLIDRATADRLRAADTDAPQPLREMHDTDPTVQRRSAAAAMFGSSVTISEVFSYLGGAFLLAAWSSFMSRAAGGQDDPELAIGAMALVAAVVLVGFGLRMRGGAERTSRAAGVAFLLAATYVGGAVTAFAIFAGLDWPAIGVIGSGAALATAVALRVIHPSVLTQVGVLTWVTAFSVAILQFFQVTLFPEDFSSETGLANLTGPDPMILVLASAAWWLITAVIIGLVGLREARSGERDHDASASRRAAVSRFWAGLTAVIGLATAVSRSTHLGDGEYGRVLEPWVGDLALLVLSAVLIERAFRRDATSYIYAAAIGLIVALTDFNVSYLSGSTEVALLIEGLILLGVGVAADRLRRRVGRDGHEPPVEPVPAEAVSASVPTGP